MSERFFSQRRKGAVDDASKGLSLIVKGASDVSKGQSRVSKRFSGVSKG